MIRYGVSVHPDGGIQFAGCDENGKQFALRLDTWAFMVAGGDAEVIVWRGMAHKPVRDTRDEFDDAECMREVERT